MKSTETSTKKTVQSNKVTPSKQQHVIKKESNNNSVSPKVPGHIQRESVPHAIRKNPSSLEHRTMQSKPSKISAAKVAPKSNVSESTTKSVLSENAKQALNTSKSVVKKVAASASSIENRTNKNGQRISIAEAAIQDIKNSEQIDKAIGTAYKGVKKAVIKKQSSTVTESPNSKKKSKKKGKKSKELIVQDLLPIKSIYNGIISTTNGKFIKIIEILPINFNDMSMVEQDETAGYFGTLFHNGPAKVHLKVITDKSNPSRIIRYIKEKCEEEKEQRGISKQVVDCAQDLINKIIAMSNDSALSKRFFFIFEYEGKSSDPEEILFEMETTKASIVSTFSNAGNTCVDYGFERSTYEAGEILYYFFNRNTCRTESLQDRIDRVNADTSIYNSHAGIKEKQTIDLDYLGPKGLSFSKNHEYVFMDGMYKTYFALKTNGHPSWATPAWLDMFTSIGDGTEVDVHIHRMPHDTTLQTIDQMNLYNTVRGREKSGNRSKQNEIFDQINNNAEIIRAMKADEDLFNVCIILTISSDTIKGLRANKIVLLKQLNRQKRYVEDAYANCREFFLATLPLTEVPMSIFNRNKRNYLTSSLQSLYMFTAFEFYDPSGFVLGENAKQNNKSVVAMNPFNTNMFTNANMSILGMTGSGKTYSTQIIARAMRLIGIRVFFILPIKAHEYLRGCQAINGLYVQLGPGMKDCINVCEIRPEQNIDKNVLQDSVQVNTSLLSKKIASLMTWLELNLVRDPMTSDEMDLAEVELARMYADFGITNDNDSIYRDKKKRIVKDMPIIGDIYDRFMDAPGLNRIARNLKKYVTGACSNMNGQTNVDLSNKYICFDVDEQNMNKELLPSFLHIACDCVYSLVKENRMYFDAVFLDEVWKLMTTPSSAEQIKDMVKLIRGYGGAVIPITQDINDYLDNPAGKAILAGTATKIVMHLEKQECKRIGDELDLTKEDMNSIVRFGRGQAMILTGNNKILVNIRASDKEDEEFTTDPNRLQEYQKRRDNTSGKSD